MVPLLPGGFRPERSGPAALIVVYADWCGFCSEFMPKLEKMRTSIPARVYKVNGDEDLRAQDWGVNGYPTVLYRPTAGGLYKYNGTRTQQGITSFIRSLER